MIKYFIGVGEDCIYEIKFKKKSKPSSSLIFKAARIKHLNSQIKVI